MGQLNPVAFYKPGLSDDEHETYTEKSKTSSVSAVRMDEYLGAFAHQLAKNVIGPSCKENNYDLPLDDLHTHNEVE